MIALIDYNMGNLLSVHKALESVGGEIELISKGSDLSKADAVILPGVGNFGDGMEHLNSLGFTPAIKEFIKSGKPFLGICLGLQMLLEKSEEAPGVEGLNIFDGEEWKSFDYRNSSIPDDEITCIQYFTGYGIVKTYIEVRNMENTSIQYPDGDGTFIDVFETELLTDYEIDLK